MYSIWVESSSKQLTEIKEVIKTLSEEEDKDYGSSSLYPTQEVLPVLWSQRASDRLQGHQAAQPLPVGAWQDRSQPDHGRFCQEAA